MSDGTLASRDFLIFVGKRGGVVLKRFEARLAQLEAKGSRVPKMLYGMMARQRQPMRYWHPEDGVGLRFRRLLGYFKTEEEAKLFYEIADAADAHFQLWEELRERSEEKRMFHVGYYARPGATTSGAERSQSASAASP